MLTFVLISMHTAMLVPLSSACFPLACPPFLTLRLGYVLMETGDGEKRQSVEIRVAEYTGVCICKN